MAAARCIVILDVSSRTGSQQPWFDALHVCHPGKLTTRYTPAVALHMLMVLCLVLVPP
jgi:hypothetical protein